MSNTKPQKCRGTYCVKFATYKTGFCEDHQAIYEDFCAATGFTPEPENDDEQIETQP